VQGAAKHYQNQPDRPPSGQGSPQKELEALEGNYKTLQERVEEECQVRKRSEERLAKMTEDIAAAKALLSERTAQLEEAQKKAEEAGSKKCELRRQVDVLRHGLLSRAQQMDGNAQVVKMRQELEAAAEQLNEKNQVKTRLQSEVKGLQQQQLETDTNRETMEMEVQRMRIRAAEGLENGNSKISEEILLLQAEKEKGDLAVAALEEKMRRMVEEEDVERQHEMTLVEDKKLQMQQNDEAQMQLQVVTEERDALREGMSTLWQEKTLMDEELESVSEGYTHLSDRLIQSSEEAMELRDRLQEYENLKNMLQENFEKSKTAATPARSPQSPPPPAPEAPPPPGGAPPAPAGGKDDEEGSHYSEDFEEPNDSD